MTIMAKQSSGVLVQQTAESVGVERRDEITTMNPVLTEQNSRSSEESKQKSDEYVDGALYQFS